MSTQVAPAQGLKVSAPDTGGAKASRVAPATQYQQNVAPVTYSATVVPQQQIILVTIPPDASPGSVLTAPLPDGRTVQVAVPPDAVPGAVIQVTVPP